MAPTTELELRAALIHSQLEAVDLRAALLQSTRRELERQLTEVMTHLTPVPPVAAIDEATQNALDAIAKMPMEQLPSYVTKQAQNDDGSAKRDAAGEVILLHQDGTPLGVIERAYVARADELRRQAGG